MSGNRLNPLDEAISFGEVLHINGVDRNVAVKIIEDYGFNLYWRPRAKAYRNRWTQAATRGYDSRVWMLKELRT